MIRAATAVTFLVLSQGMSQGMASGPAHAASEGTRLLRQPSVSQRSVAFAYGGDIWIVGRAGGEALRITTFPGVEGEPALSPDGSTVAFTGEYDGNVDVYTVPAGGGEPKRLTWHPTSDHVRGWTTGGEAVLFASDQSTQTGHLRLFTVPSGGGAATPLPMPRAFDGAFSPDGRRIVYLQHPLAAGDELHEKSFWRNYRGGRVHPLWVFSLASHDVEEIPWRDSNESSPMWIDAAVYFLSDRDLAVNLYTWDAATKKVRQLTHHTKTDIGSASAGGGVIVYEMAGSLHLYDPKAATDQPITIHARGDLPWTRPHFAEVAEMIQSSGLSPTGARAVFEARGEIFTVPAEKGDWRNLTRSSGAADRAPAWSPDGRQIAWFSDSSGEYRLMIGDQKGEGKPREIGLDSPTFYYAPSWSPDGKRLLFHDVRLNLYVVEVETGKATRVDADTYTHPERSLSAAWAPDSKWIAYAKRLDTQLRAIRIWSVEGGKSRQVTDGLSDATAPVFSADGRHLWFLSGTDMALNTGWVDMSSIDRPLTRSIYLAVLSSEDPSPLLPESDDEPDAKVDDKTGEESKHKQDDKKDDTKGTMKDENGGDDKSHKSDEPKPVRIDFERLDRRVVALDVPAARYGALAAGPGGVLYYSEITEPADDFDPVETVTVHRYTLKDREGKPFLAGVNGWTLSRDGGRMLYQAGKQWGIVKTEEEANVGDGAIDVPALRSYVLPREEWRQMLREAWRLHRDYFYDKGLHGADWPGALDRSLSLLDHVAHRSDLAYLIAMMAGELSVGHSFSVGGDTPKVETVPVGLLGADFEAKDGRYRMKRIYTGESWNPELEAPLSAPGVKVSEGDYLLEVNGLPLEVPADPHSLFVGTAGRQTTLRVNDKPSSEGSRLVTVVPTASDSELRLRAWTEGNRLAVDRLSGGRLAYVYLPNTSGAGYTWFNRYYFAQQDRQGVIIDERFNGGGYVADYMIDIMSRRLLGYFSNPADPQRSYSVPMAGIFGPKVMLINESAGSGGDFLPWLFRRNQLGTLVGTRTWGGLVGIWDFPPLIDGGIITVPRGGFFNLNGQWEVENEGVAPDIEVRQFPKDVIAGGDPQLEKAVAEALRLLAANPPLPRSRPQPPSPKRVLRPGE